MASPPQKRSGSCLCGNIKYTITNKHGPDMTQLVCHCPNCLHGMGSSGAYSFCPIENFEFAEGAKQHIKIYHDQETTSKDEMQRQFCTNCGSCVLITTDHNTSVAIVPVGTMDCGGKGWYKPEVECFGYNKKDWMPELQGTQIWEHMPTFG
ncbi:hypothetical protein LTR56_013394 [Elasticomyces elasticus]|nr:hypothetical protein LTR56_013394 [Elasticomyces elasticus]KAK3665707.1 hypothetical protein LTR22_003338 [Elasticomyces elasticus]KAK4910014.1 hypothetical protein LTR49_021288 [Elasticomyces elasticus]KAK5757253.1 hypothetical protein LTS12_012611 [Elasticomyces elasticus]